ncbi:MAG: PIN domain-containing protein [Planctomycetes bacterium]|nr:PIN domain-containing protein [Planctomycetota bacterium]
MRAAVLLDTGPLVALLDRGDKFHEWAKASFADLHAPFLTCEPVLAESCYLLRNLSGGSQAVLELIGRGFVDITFRMVEEVPTLNRLMTKYSDVPMSLADACLVRMAEMSRDSMMMTVDTDFMIYRIHGRQPIRLILPED